MVEMLKFRLDESDAARFDAMTDTNGPVIRPELGQCWVWTGSTSQFGHGQFAVKPSHGEAGTAYAGHGAHRIAWLMAHPGETIPKGTVVRHRCDNPPCVRPDHLELGTRGDNLRDMYDRGRACLGERHGQSKLTDSDVVSMREDYATNGTAIQELARRHGVTDMTVRDVLIGKSWRHVTGGVPVERGEPSEEEKARTRAARSRRPNARKGEQHHKARMTPEQVRELCDAYLAGERAADLARRYGVTKTAVTLILSGKNWKSVTGGVDIRR